MRFKKIIRLAAATAVASTAVLAASAASAKVTYTFSDDNYSFSDTFANAVTSTETAKPVFTDGTFSGLVTYAVTAAGDLVSFNGNSYNFGTTAFSTKGFYTTVGDTAEFSTLKFTTTPAAPEASDYAFMIAGLAIAGGYIAYRKRRQPAGAAFSAA